MFRSTVDGLEELLSGLVEPFGCRVVTDGCGGFIQLFEGNTRGVEIGSGLDITVFTTHRNR